MKRKYYTEDILRAEKVKTLTTGDYFGESLCVANHPKSNYMYVVSSSEAHLLTLSKEDYHQVMRQLESRNYKKLEAFIKLLPSFEKEEIQRFSEYFSQKSFQADEVIYFQGASAQDFYIVQSGEVQLLRKLTESRERAGFSFVPIASVVKDQAFGEECLLSLEIRQGSAIAKASNTSVLVLKASLIPEIEGEFEGIFTELRKGAEEKFQWRQRKAKELFEKNENTSTSPSDCSPQHSLSPIRERKSLFNPRHSIQIPNRRSFLLEKSPVQSNSASNLPNSLASISSIITPRKLSDGQLPQKAQKSELYKSRFGRASVISDLSQITRPGEKIASFQPANLSPVSDLKAINFRNALYGGNSRKSSLGKVSGNSQDAQQKIKTVFNKPTNNQTPFIIMIKKRVAN